MYMYLFSSCMMWSKSCNNCYDNNLKMQLQAAYNNRINYHNVSFIPVYLFISSYKYVPICC